MQLIAVYMTWDGQVGKLTNCSFTQCQHMIARENSWHLNEIGVVTCAKKTILGPFDTADNLTPRTI